MTLLYSTLCKKIGEHHSILTLSKAECGICSEIQPQFDDRPPFS